MDTGGLSATERNWIFSRPHFDVLVDGKAHRVADAKSWRQKYDKPYIPQEAWDDNGVKYHMGSDRHNIRKYFWKFMMTKSQQMDMYARRSLAENNYDYTFNPNGFNEFENDAIVLRTFWESLVDYPNLWFGGSVSISANTNHKYLLSSSREAVAYVSSNTGAMNVNFPAQPLQINDSRLTNGTYRVDIIKPDRLADNGLLRRMSNVSVSNGALTVQLPTFRNDVVVHVY
jgi:hypothetical protein